MSWKRAISWLLIFLATFALGVAATLVWLRHSISQSEAVKPPQPAESPILAFCELVNNPDKYSGHTVRINAVLSGFIHGMFLYNPNCVTVDTRTAVFFNSQNKQEIESTLQKTRGSVDWREPVDIIALGEFRKVTPSNQSDTIYDTAPLQFEIVRVENASRVR
jgi:hypothetical protein